MSNSSTLRSLSQRLRRVARLVEAKRPSGERTKILYHIGKRPASPKPLIESRVADPRHVGKEAVFLAPNWIPIWNKHGIRGNVYKYKVPMAAIKEAGGPHTITGATEVLFPKEVWEKYNLSSTLLGKAYTEQEADQYARDVFTNSTDMTRSKGYKSKYRKYLEKHIMEPLQRSLKNAPPGIRKYLEDEIVQQKKYIDKLVETEVPRN